jgi:hypothetical protein
MRFSFTGSFVPFTYRCPQCFKFRAVDRIYPPKPETEAETPAPISARESGIVDHAAMGELLTGFTSVLGPSWDEPPFDYTKSDLLIDLVAEIESRVGVDPDTIFGIEAEYLTDIDYNPVIAGTPAPEHSIYSRPDFFIASDGRLRVFDWKFGNPDFGASTYYRETDWYACAVSAHFEDVAEVETIVHFPNSNYTLPSRLYTMPEIARLRFEFQMFFREVLTTRVFFPKPSRASCRFCDYRSEDAGGMGICEDAAL